jgi:hypothetical protein
MMRQIKVPKARQAKYEEGHEQEQEHLKGHNDPRLYGFPSSWLSPTFDDLET